MDEQIGVALTKPLARVNFEYFREKLGVHQIKVPSKGEVMSLEAFLTWWQYWFLPWLDVSDVPL